MQGSFVVVFAVVLFSLPVPSWSFSSVFSPDLTFSYVGIHPPCLFFTPGAHHKAALAPWPYFPVAEGKSSHSSPYIAVEAVFCLFATFHLSLHSVTPQAQFPYMKNLLSQNMSVIPSADFSWSHPTFFSGAFCWLYHAAKSVLPPHLFKWDHLALPIPQVWLRWIKHLELWLLLN